MDVRSISLPVGNLFFIIVLVFGVFVLPVSAITLTPGASSGSATIPNGDPVYVTGIATGHPANGLNVWLIGYNTAKITNIQVNSDNTYKYEIKSAETQNLAPGQYLVIVQHPMMNGQFDIYYSSSTGQVINRQMNGGGSTTGTAIFQLTNSGSLQSPDAASALMRAINSQNVDDTFATASFYINPPNAMVNPVGDHIVGEKFTITGSTNLAVGDKLQVDVYSSSFQPTKKSQSGAYSGASGVVEVTTGNNGKNQWSFFIDSSGFKPDEYIVSVKGILQDVKGSATFNILPATQITTIPQETSTTPLRSTTPASTIVTTLALSDTVPVTTHAEIPFWAVICGLAVGSMAIILLKKQR